MAYPPPEHGQVAGKTDMRDMHDPDESVPEIPRTNYLGQSSPDRYFEGLLDEMEMMNDKLQSMIEDKDVTQWEITGHLPKFDILQRELAATGRMMSNKVGLVTRIKNNVQSYVRRMNWATILALLVVLLVAVPFAAFKGRDHFKRPGIEHEYIETDMGDGEDLTRRRMAGTAVGKVWTAVEAAVSTYLHTHPNEFKEQTPRDTNTHLQTSVRTYDSADAYHAWILAEAAYCDAELIETWNHDESSPCPFIPHCPPGATSAPCHTPDDLRGVNNYPRFDLLERSVVKTDNELAFCGYDDHKGGQIVVSFRGTDNKDNVLSDLDHSWGAPGHHGGFHQAWIRLINGKVMGDTDKTLAHKIIELIAAHPSAPVVVIGHSMGGAIAQIAALELKHEPQYTMREVHVITFGSPRAFDVERKNEFEDAIDINWRIVWKTDPVPKVPFMGLNYIHTRPLFRYIGIDNEDYEKFKESSGPQTRSGQSPHQIPTEWMYVICLGDESMTKLKASDWENVCQMNVGDPGHHSDYFVSREQDGGTPAPFWPAHVKGIQPHDVTVHNNGGSKSRYSTPDSQLP